MPRRASDRPSAAAAAVNPGSAPGLDPQYTATEVRLTDTRHLQALAPWIRIMIGAWARSGSQRIARRGLVQAAPGGYAAVTCGGGFRFAQPVIWSPLQGWPPGHPGED